MSSILTPGVRHRQGRESPPRHLRTNLITMMKTMTLCMLGLCQLTSSLADTCSCALPPVNATWVDLSTCCLPEVPWELNKFTNVTRLDLSHNNIKNVNANSFVNLTKLEEVDFSFNYDLIVPDDKCFLVSVSITSLDLSYTQFWSIKPKSLKCLANLTSLIFQGRRECKQTQTLVSEEGLNITVICKRVPQSKDNTIQPPPIHHHTPIAKHPQGSTPVDISFESPKEPGPKILTTDFSNEQDSSHVWIIVLSVLVCGFVLGGLCYTFRIISRVITFLNNLRSNGNRDYRVGRANNIA